MLLMTAGESALPKCSSVGSVENLCMQRVRHGTLNSDFARTDARGR